MNIKDVLFSFGKWLTNGFGPSTNSLAPVSRSIGNSGFIRDMLYGGRRDTSDITRRPYTSNAWVYACVSVISRNIKSLPKVLLNEDDPDNVIREHDILELLRKPNSMMSGSQFWEKICLDLLLPTMNTPGGQCFIVGEKWNGDIVNFAKGEIPDFAYPYSDWVIQPIHDSVNRLISGWKMVIDGKTIREFSTEEVVRIRKLNPYSNEYGLSPFKSIEHAVIQTEKGNEYNTRIMDNHGIVAGTLSTDVPMTLEEMQPILQSWIEAHGGAGNAGKTAMLPYGLKYDQFARSAVDMQWLEMLDYNRHQVQAVYGVPDSEIAIFESGMNRATADTAARNFWQKTLVPLDYEILEPINNQWVRNAADGMSIVSDKSQIDALREDKNERLERAIKMIRDGRVPPNEAYRVNGIEIEADAIPYGDQVFVSALLVPIDAVAGVSTVGESGDTKPNGSKGDEDDLDGKDDKKKSKLSVDECAGGWVYSNHERDTNSAHGSTSEGLNHIGCEHMRTRSADDGESQEEERDLRYSAEEREAMSDLYIRNVLNPGEKTMRTLFERLFQKQKREMLGKVDRWESGQKAVVIRAALRPEDFLFDVEAANNELLGLYKPEVERQMKRAADDVNKLLPVNWVVTDEAIGAFVDLRRMQLAGIDDLTFNMVRDKVADIIADGIENNLTTTEIAREIRDGITERMTIRTAQASRIARTEVGTITNQTHHDAYVNAGIEKHSWLTSRDERVRSPLKGDAHDHRIDGEVREVGKRFSNDLEYPLDPSGDPGNVINCRCRTIPVLEG